MIQVAPRRKKFDGKWYDFHYGHEHKADAERLAKNLRSGAYNARIVKIPGILGYFVYTRVKNHY